MKCPFCSFVEDRVVDSREGRDGNEVRRRRECLRCGRRFTTYERLERLPTLVIKRDGRREPFDRDKLLAGILIACKKRPVPRRELEAIVEVVDSELARGDGEIEAERIGEIVMGRLRELDPVAYVRFASVYRRFEDVEQFVAELETLRRDREV